MFPFVLFLFDLALIAFVYYLPGIVKKYFDEEYSVPYRIAVFLIRMLAIIWLVDSTISLVTAIIWG